MPEGANREMLSPAITGILFPAHFTTGCGAKHFRSGRDHNH